MSYMRPSYVHFTDFDTEHTRFATKYSLYLYREQGFDDENKVGILSSRHVPWLHHYNEFADEHSCVAFPYSSFLVMRAATNRFDL